MKLLYSALCLILALFSCNQSNNQEKEKIKAHLFFINSIIKELLPNESNCSKIDSSVVLSYEVENQIKSRIENYNSYFTNADTIYKYLLRNLIMSQSINNGNLIAYAKCNDINKTILFTEPIYNTEHTKSIVVINLICGKECEETTLLLLEYKNKNWKIIARNTISVQ